MRRLTALRSAMAALLALAGCGDDAPADGAGGAGGKGGSEGGMGGAPTDVTSTATGMATCDALQCDAGEFCHAGACHSCDAPTGTQHDLVLTLGDDEEDRSYFLHIPASYSCRSPAPLLVDFHGTAGGVQPEEAYQLDSLLALSDAEGVIVVRPRSRSSERGGQQIYRWDQNPGDLDRNVLFTQHLVEALRTQYRIDEDRIYASGFSSGSNMTSQFLGPARGLFKGLAPIAGGVWSDPGISAFDAAAAPRIYLGTGYRDYLYGTMRDLVGILDASGFPQDKLLVREYDTGHDLYAWHWPELWAFLDQGKKPLRPELAEPWAPETLPSPSSVVTLTKRTDGSLVATGAKGEVWSRDISGSWTDPDIIGDFVVSGACADAAGRMFVVGEYNFAASDADLQFGAPTQVPEFFGATFGTSYLNGIGCSGASPLAAAGYWTGARSDDNGVQWSGLEMDAGGYFAQPSAVHVTDAGTIVAVGYYDYIGRGAAGATALDMRPHPSTSEWLNDVASAPGGAIWVVGDHGTVLHSGDDGVTWSSQDSGTEEDLYAVTFANDGLLGAAVGRRGTVVVTYDGGAAWEDLSTGVDGYLGGAVFVNATELVVAGEKGLIARVDLLPP